MDIRCPICGEPWDTDSLHDMIEEGVAKDYNEAVSMFRSKGCKAIDPGANCVRVNNETTETSRMLMDLLGDDVDAIAGFEEDFLS